MIKFFTIFALFAIITSCGLKDNEPLANEEETTLVTEDQIKDDQVQEETPESDETPDELVTYHPLDTNKNGYIDLGLNYGQGELAPVEIRDGVVDYDKNWDQLSVREIVYRDLEEGENYKIESDHILHGNGKLYVARFHGEELTTNFNVSSINVPLKAYGQGLKKFDISIPGFPDAGNFPEPPLHVYPAVQGYNMLITASGDGDVLVTTDQGDPSKYYWVKVK